MAISHGGFLYFEELSLVELRIEKTENYSTKR